MVTKDKRKDSVVRVSKWLDEEIEKYISNRKSRVEYPTKRNFVDIAILKFLEEKGVKVQ